MIRASGAKVQFLAMAAVLLAAACGRLKPPGFAGAGGAGGAAAAGGAGGAPDGGPATGSGGAQGGSGGRLDSGAPESASSDGRDTAAPDDGGQDAPLGSDAEMVEVGPPAACPGVPPPTPLITGAPNVPVGGTPYTFVATGLTAPVVTVLRAADNSIAGLQAAVNPGTSTNAQAAYLGFGMGFGAPPCLDASAFNAVTFTITGDIGTCGLTFTLLVSEDNAVANGPYGRCSASSCLSPSSGQLTTGINVVRFADMSRGTPVATVDPAALNGVQWTMTVPTNGTTAPCVANFTITDVSFIVAEPPEGTDGGPDATGDEDAATEEAGTSQDAGMTEAPDAGADANTSE